MGQKTTRRAFAAYTATAACSVLSARGKRSSDTASEFRPRFAICNETFRKWPFDRAFAFAAECGYRGIEIAPFTISNLVTAIPSKRRREIRRLAEKNGLEVVGLHWLLARTKGFHLTSPDSEIRQNTAAYLGELARFCAGLGVELLAELAKWLEIIAEALAWLKWPGAAVLDPPIRSVLADRFPYAIGYRAHADRVRVLAFAHTSLRSFYATFTGPSEWNPEDQKSRVALRPRSLLPVPGRKQMCVAGNSIFAYRLHERLPWSSRPDADASTTIESVARVWRRFPRPGKGRAKQRPLCASRFSKQNAARLSALE